MRPDVGASRAPGRSERRPGSVIPCVARHAPCIRPRQPRHEPVLRADADPRSRRVRAAALAASAAGRERAARPRRTKEGRRGVSFKAANMRPVVEPRRVLAARTRRTPGARSARRRGNHDGVARERGGRRVGERPAPGGPHAEDLPDGNACLSSPGEEIRARRRRAHRTCREARCGWRRESRGATAHALGGGSLARRPRPSAGRPRRGDGRGPRSVAAVGAAIGHDAVRQRPSPAAGADLLRGEHHRPEERRIGLRPDRRATRRGASGSRARASGPAGSGRETRGRRHLVDDAARDVLRPRCGRRCRPAHARISRSTPRARRAWSPSTLYPRSR